MNNGVKPMIRALLIFVFLLASACAHDNAAKNAPEPNPCSWRSDTTVHKGKVTLQGPVSYTKGAQLWLQDPNHGGVILKVPKGPDRKRWLETQAIASGDLCVYTCGPMEQCLTSGRIQYLINVEIKAAP